MLCLQPYLTAFRGHQAISAPYRFALSCVFVDANTCHKLVGQRVYWSDGEANQATQYFGRVTQISLGHALINGMACVVQVEPEVMLWPDDEKTRHFHQQPVSEIIAAVFAAQPFIHYQLQLTQPEPDPLSLQVQWQEPDWPFIERLLQQQGWFYLFVHDAELQQERLLITDCLTQLPRQSLSLAPKHCRRWQEIRDVMPAPSQRYQVSVPWRLLSPGVQALEGRDWMIAASATQQITLQPRGLSITHMTLVQAAAFRYPTRRAMPLRLGLAAAEVADTQPVLKIQQQHEWAFAPMRLTWAGQGHGLFFYPKQQDPVWVAYEQAKAQQPLVLCVANYEDRITGFYTQYHQWQWEDQAQQQHWTLNSQGDFAISIAGNALLQVEHHYRWQVLQGDWLWQVGKSCEIKAEQKIRLAAGNNFLMMLPDRIILKAPNININTNQPGTSYLSSCQRSAVDTEPGAPRHDAPRHDAADHDAQVDEAQEPLSPKASHQHRAKDQAQWWALPVTVAWRKVLPEQQAESLATVYRLPVALRQRVFEALLESSSPIQRAIQSWRSVDEISQVGLEAERDFVCPNAANWRSIIRQHHPSLYQEVCQALALAEQIKCKLPTGWVYVIIETPDTKRCQLFSKTSLHEAKAKTVLLPFANHKQQPLKCYVFYSDIRLSQARLEWLLEDKKRLIQRAGAAIQVAKWASFQVQAIRKLTNGQTVAIVAAKKPSQPSAFWRNTDANDYVAHDLLGHPDQDGVMLWLDNPLGVLAEINANIYQFWQRLTELINTLNQKEQPSYVGEARQQSENYFSLALLANQLFYNVNAQGSYQCITHYTPKDRGFFTGFIGQGTPLLNAQRKLDRDKVNWALRKADRQLLKWLIDQLQQIAAQCLLQQNLTRHSWLNDIDCVLQDGFAASSPALGYQRLVAAVAMSCQDPNTLDQGLDVEEQFINRIEFVDLLESPYLGLQPMPHDFWPSRTIEYVPTLFGHAEIVNGKIKRFILKPLPPGVAYVKALYQPTHLLYDSLFPTEAKPVSGARQLQGHGKFWPEGLRQAWLGHYPKQQEDNVHVARQAIKYFEHILTAWLACQSMVWREVGEWESREMRQVTLLMLGEIDPAFKQENIFLHLSLPDDEQYHLLSASLTQVEPSHSDEPSTYAVIDRDRQLRFFADEQQALHVLQQRNKTLQQKIKSLHGNLHMTYVHCHKRLDDMVSDLKGGVRFIYSLFAFYDLFQQCRVVLQSPLQSPVWLYQLMDWVKLSMKAINALEVTRDMVRVVREHREELFEFATRERQGGIGIMRCLSHVSAGLSMVTSWFDCYKAYRQGDPAALCASGLESSMSSALTMRHFWRSAMKATDNMAWEAVTSAEVELFSEDLLAMLLPELGLLDILFWVITAVVFGIRLLEDNVFERWARRCPFSRKLPPDSSLHGVDAAVMWRDLIQLTMQPTLRVLNSSPKQRTVQAIVAGLPLLQQQATLQLQGVWRLQWLDPVAMADPILHIPWQSQSFFEVYGAIEQARKPIVLLPQGRVIGYELSIEVSDEQIAHQWQTLQPLLEQRLHGQHCRHALLRLNYCARARIKWPDDKDSDTEVFARDSHFVHNEHVFIAKQKDHR